jgi:hypothetical protein
MDPIIWACRLVQLCMSTLIQDDEDIFTTCLVVLVELLIIVRIISMMVSSPWLLRRWLLQHLLVIQKSSAFLKIMPYCAVDHAPLLNVSMTTEQSLLLLLSRLLLSIPTIGCIDFPIFLLLLLSMPLVT